MKPEFTSIEMIPRIIRGIGANMIGWTINFISKIALVPLFLKMWGVDLYGEWVLLSSVVAYLSLTDLGGQLYIINNLTQLYSKGKYKEYKKVLASGLLLYSILPICVYLIFILVVYTININLILNFPLSNSTLIKTILSILAFQIVVSLPYGILIGIYRTVGKLPKGVMLANAAQLLLILLTMAGLWFGGGMIMVASLQLLPFFLVTLLALPELISLIPETNTLPLKQAKLSTIRTFINPSLHFFSIKLSQALTIQGQVILVGMLLAPPQVVLFSTQRTIVYLVRQVLDTLANSSFPEITRLDAQESHQELCSLFRGILRTTMVSAISILFVLHLFGAELYSLWVQNKIAFDQTLFDLLLLYIFQFVFWGGCMNVLMATNNHRFLSKLLVVSAIISLVISFLLGSYFGLRGIAGGMILGDLLLPFWFVPFLLHKKINQIGLMFFLSELIPSVVALLTLFFFQKLTIIVFAIIFWWLWQGLNEAKKSSI